MIDAITMGIKYIYEVFSVTARWAGMTPSHRKEIIKALQSDVAAGQWVAGSLSKADARTTTKTTAQRRIFK